MDAKDDKVQNKVQNDDEFDDELIDEYLREENKKRQMEEVRRQSNLFYYKFVNNQL